MLDTNDLRLLREDAPDRGSLRTPFDVSYLSARVVVVTEVSGSSPVVKFRPRDPFGIESVGSAVSFDADVYPEDFGYVLNPPAVVGALAVARLVPHRWVLELGGSVEDCIVCFRATICGGATAAPVEFKIYPSADGTFSGTPLFTGTVNPSTLKYCIPFSPSLEGSRDVEAIPPVGSNMRGIRRTVYLRCFADPLVFDLLPDKYSAQISVLGCNGCCAPIGTRIEFQDGTNSVTALTTTETCVITFTDLDSPDVGDAWSVRITAPAGCGWAVKEDSGFLTRLEICGVFNRDYALDPAPGFTCYGFHTHRPLPTTLHYTDSDYGFSADLEYVGPVDWGAAVLGMGATSNVLATWIACGSHSVAGAVPVDCGTSEGDCDQFAYQAQTATVPFLVMLGLYQLCLDPVLHWFRFRANVVATRTCGPAVLVPWRPVGQVWMAPTAGGPYVVRNIVCFTGVDAHDMPTYGLTIDAESGLVIACPPFGTGGDSLAIPGGVDGGGGEGGNVRLYQDIESGSVDLGYCGDLDFTTSTFIVSQS